jgi:hypothetical protein
MDLNNNNITFFFEDLVTREDNSLELEKMMQEFELDAVDNDNDINNNFYNANICEELSDLSYFIKKNLYIGNDELYYNEEYKIKDLLNICKYYGIMKNVKASKCKKQDIISTIIYFENSPENYEMVEKRHKMWAYMTELLEDSKMRSYLLPPFNPPFSPDRAKPYPK